MLAAAGSLSMNRVLQAERNSKRQRSGLGQLHDALAVVTGEGKTSGTSRQHIQQGISHRLDRIVPASFRHRRDTEQRRYNGTDTQFFGVCDLRSSLG